MSLTIGRLTINSPAKLSVDENGTLNFSGILNNQQIVDMKYLRDELTGLASMKETVPFKYTGDTTLNGFCQILTAQINMNKISFGGFSYRISINQLGDANNIKFESRFTGAVIANNFGISSTTNGQFHAPPVSSFNYDSEQSFNSVTRTTDEGTQYVRYGTTLKGGSAFWYVGEDDFYKGSCKIVAGNKTRTSLFFQDDITNSYITNGIIKVAFGEGTNQTRFTTSIYDSGSFGTAKEYKIESGSSLAEFRGWKTLHLLKNSPEQVGVRLTSYYNANTSGLLTADFTLRRGAHHANILLTQWTAANMKISLTSSEAGTKHINEKYIQSDLSTTRYLLGSANTITFDETNGAILRSSTDKFRVMVGYVLGGSSATSFNTADSVYDQYLDNAYEVVKAVKP
jgi:hypothetical protein